MRSVGSRIEQFVVCQFNDVKPIFTCCSRQLSSPVFISQQNMIIDELEIDVRGRLCKMAKLHNEYYEYLDNPAGFIDKMRAAGAGIDMFTFVPEIHGRSPKLSFHQEFDRIAVIPLTTYENWWKHQIADKTRNMARKAAKKGLEIKVVPFDDEFVRGIQAINDEAPIRQGKPYWHYQEDFATVKRLNITFEKQSEFIGAYLGAELIGYIKLVKGNGKASIMQILSKIAHRDKAPNNALMAKAVEICTEKKIPALHYAFWSRRGLGDFKISHGFECVEIPRYYVPLTRKGTFVLKCRLHRKLKERVPEKWMDIYTGWRAKYLAFKYKPQL